MGRILIWGAILAAAAVHGAAAQSQPQDFVSFVADGAGHWAWQWKPAAENARSVALQRCARPTCAEVFTVRARCIAYAEDRSGPYRYGAAYGASHEEANAIAIGKCGEKRCRLIRSHCQGEDPASAVR
jgi:hypothetical protein